MVEKYKGLIEEKPLTQEETEKAIQETKEWIDEVMKDVSASNLPRVLREQAF